MFAKQFQRNHCQKKYICNVAGFSPTALLEISFLEIILRLPVDISLIENRISYQNKYFEDSSYIYFQTSSNSTVAALYYRWYLILTNWHKHAAFQSVGVQVADW